MNGEVIRAFGCRKNILNVNQNGGDLGPPLPLAFGSSGRLYGITAVRDVCPRGKLSLCRERRVNEKERQKRKMSKVLEFGEL